jgi:hypothetical protein
VYLNGYKTLDGNGRHFYWLGFSIVGREAFAKNDIGLLNNKSFNQNKE